MSAKIVLHILVENPLCIELAACLKFKTSIL